MIKGEFFVVVKVLGTLIRFLIFVEQDNFTGWILD